MGLGFLGILLVSAFNSCVHTGTSCDPVGPPVSHLRNEKVGLEGPGTPLQLKDTVAVTILFIKDLFIYPFKTFQISTMHDHQPEGTGDAESEQQ